MDAQLIEAQAILDQMNELADRRADILNEWAQRTCPFKVGEKITIPLRGYTHSGKPAVVTKVFFDHNDTWKGDHRWKVAVTLLKKDGSLSKQETEFCSWQHERSQR